MQKMISKFDVYILNYTIVCRLQITITTLLRKVIFIEEKQYFYIKQILDFHQN